MAESDRLMSAGSHDSLDEPLRTKLSDADDRIRLNHWMPPQQGIAPRIRIGRRWINTMWGLPIAATALLCLIAVAQSLREIPGVEAFIRQHPGIAQAAPSVDSGFPWWLQLQHFLNMFFMLFIMRAGLQILADHPRLYWGRDCTPGADWFRFQVPVPKGRVWTAKDDSVTLPTWLGIPGLRHTLGLSRWWHFSVNLLWLINGVAFYALLFSTDQWRRLVPLTWEVFPAALSTAIQYASLNFPVDHSWTRYNGLQQLSYFITVFVAAPVSIATGLMQSPAISNALARSCVNRVRPDALRPMSTPPVARGNLPRSWHGTARHPSSRTECCWRKASASDRTEISPSRMSTLTFCGRSALLWAHSTITVQIKGKRLATKIFNSRCCLRTTI